MNGATTKSSRIVRIKKSMLHSGARLFKKTWMKIAASTAIALISYSLILQNLHNSELLVLFFTCQCNHDSSVEIHKTGSKTNHQDMNSLPDCHKKANLPHVCSCKNGSILKKMNDFLAQFLFVQTATSLYIIAWIKIDIVSQASLFLVQAFPNRLERPPSIS